MNQSPGMQRMQLHYAGVYAEAHADGMQSVCSRCPYSNCMQNPLCRGYAEVMQCMQTPA